MKTAATRRTRKSAQILRALRAVRDGEANRAPVAWNTWTVLMNDELIQTVEEIAIVGGVEVTKVHFELTDAGRAALARMES